VFGCDFAKCFLVNAGNSLFNIVFQFFKASWVIRRNSFFEKFPQKEVWRGKGWRLWKPKAVISAVLSLDEHLSQKIHFAGTVFSKISVAVVLVFLRRCGTSHLSTLSDVGHFSCRKHLLHPEMLLPVGVLFSYSVLVVRIRIAKCFTNSSKWFRCEVMFENEHTFFSWTHHVCTCTVFCATGVSSGLATRVTLTRVTGEVGAVYYMGGGPASDCIFVP
jgi:nitrate reductase gamma subunit